MRRAMAAVVGSFVLLVAWGPLATAHETAPTLTPRIDGFLPEVDGVRAFVQASQDATLLTLEPEVGTTVEVLDDDGEPWARVTATTVTVDVSNPAFHAGTSPRGAVPASLPAAEDPWRVIGRDGRLQWFEHRLHPDDLDIDPAVLTSDEPQDVAAWSVPLRVDGAAVDLTGRLRHVPVTGRLEPRLVGDRQLAPGVTIDVAAGAVPAFFLRNDSDRPVTVLSRDGSPYLVLDEDGAAVNLASATWAEQRRYDGLVGEGTPDEPVFERVSDTATHSWLDSRAALPGVLPDDEVRSSDQEVVVRTWSIPVEVDGELVAVEGQTVWVPLSVQRAAAEGTTAVPRPEYLVAAALALALLGLWFRRHRQSRSPTDGGTRDL